MPLDGATIHCLRAELQAAVDCHIDKIHMPGKNEFIFALRGREGTKRLFLSLSPDCPRVSFTDTVLENPANPPMFCMLLRKHLASGRILAVEGIGAERLLLFRVQSTNELGDRVVNTLVCELTGHKTNLILLNGQGKILDAARRSDLEAGGRLIQPGILYVPPENSEKTDFLNGDLSKAAQESLQNSEKRLADGLLSHIAGISPLICREIAFLCTGDCDAPSGTVTPNALADRLTALRDRVKLGGTPYILYDEMGNPRDFSFMEIRQYGDAVTAKELPSYSRLLDLFYGEREHNRRMEQGKGDLVKLVKTLIARNGKKLLLRQRELKKTENREQLRIYGELIKANLYRIEKGANRAVVENYYDPDCKAIEIPLNAALSPAANAAKYFKDYKKACTAEQTLGGLIAQCEAEGEYLESVLFELQAADTTAELTQIRTELTDAGYLSKKQSQKRQKTNAKPLEFEKNGFEILVGRNNLQNDELTLRTAAKSDLWFHTKNIHGSHVILRTGGKTPDEETLIYAATLAARYSKAAGSNQVPVDYTPVKYVKKPAGAKPGMVIYTTNKTLYVNPLGAGGAES